MTLRILDYLTNIAEYDGVSLSANLRCTCGTNEFQFLHTGKQTKGIFAPFIIRKKRPLILKAICPCCQNAIIIYDSTRDGAHAQIQNGATEFVPFVTNKITTPFSVAIKYNYLPEKFKIEGHYSNLFKNCFIYIMDKNGKEEHALIEE